MHTPTRSHPFRDASDGAKARREKLLGDRRADLAIMSHAIRRTYVARSSRVGVYLALVLGGGLLLATSLSLELAKAVTSLLPGEAPAPLANLLLGTWVAAALAGLLARSIAERRFTLAMSRAVLPSEDLHHDVARLQGESPNAVGRRMAQKQARPNQALPILVAGLILPATAMAGMLAVDAAGYPSVDALEELLTSHPTLLMAFASLSACFALVLAIRPRRAPLALAALATAHVAFVGTHEGLALGLGAVFLAGLSWALRRRHRREDQGLGQDGAPLPMPLHLRKRMRALGSHVLANLLRLRAWRPRRVHAFGLGLVLVATGSLVLHQSAQVANSMPQSASTPALPSGHQPDVATGIVSLLDSSDGLQLAFEFSGDSSVSASEFLNGAVVPAGWRARIVVTKVNSSGAFFLSFFDDTQAPRHLAQDETTLTVEHDNCGTEPLPLQLSASPYGTHYTTSTDSELTIRYHVTLELIGDCQDL